MGKICVRADKSNRWTALTCPTDDQDPAELFLAAFLPAKTLKETNAASN